MSLAPNTHVTNSQAWDDIQLYPRLSQQLREANSHMIADRVMQLAPQFYRDIPEIFRSDRRDWVQQILRGERLAEDFRHIPPSFWKRHDPDHQLLQATLSQHPHLYHQVSPALLQEFGMYADPGSTLEDALAAVDRDPQAYHYARPEFQRDRQLASAFLQRAPGKYGYVPESLRADPAIGQELAQIVMKSPDAHTHYSSLHPVIRERSEDLALSFISSLPKHSTKRSFHEAIPHKLWRNSYELAKKIVRRDPSTYAKLSPELREKEAKLARLAVDHDASTYQSVPLPIRERHAHLAEAALTKNSAMIAHVPHSVLEQMPQRTLDIVNSDLGTYPYAPTSLLRQHPDLTQRFVDQDPMGSRYEQVPLPIREQNHELAFHAVARNAANYKHVPSTISSDPVHGVELMRVDKGRNYEHIPEKIRYGSSGTALPDIPDDVPMHMHVQYYTAMKAIKLNPKNYAFVPNHFKDTATASNLALAQAAVKRDPGTYHLIPPILKYAGGRKLAKLAMKKGDNLSNVPNGQTLPCYLNNYDLVPPDLKSGLQELCLKLAKEAVTENALAYYDHVPTDIKLLGGVPLAYAAVEKYMDNFRTVPKSLQDGVMQLILLNSTIDNPMLGYFKEAKVKSLGCLLRNIRRACDEIQTGNQVDDTLQRVQYWNHKAILHLSYMFWWNEKYGQPAKWNRVLSRVAHMCMLMLHLRKTFLSVDDAMRKEFTPQFEYIISKAIEHLGKPRQNFDKTAQENLAEINSIKKHIQRYSEITEMLETTCSCNEEIKKLRDFFSKYILQNQAGGKTLFQYPGPPELVALQFRPLTTPA